MHEKNGCSESYKQKDLASSGIEYQSCRLSREGVDYFWMGSFRASFSLFCVSFWHGQGNLSFKYLEKNFFHAPFLTV